MTPGTDRHEYASGMQPIQMKMTIRGKNAANKLVSNLVRPNRLEFGKTSIITGQAYSSTQDNTLSDSIEQSIISNTDAINTTNSVVGTNVTGVQKLRVPYQDKIVTTAKVK